MLRVSRGPLLRLDVAILGAFARWCDTQRMSHDVELYEARLDAELNEAYYRALAQRYDRIDKALRVVSALASSAAFVTVLRQAAGGLVATLSAAAGVASVVSLIMRFGERTSALHDLAVGWSEIVGKLSRAKRNGSKYDKVLDEAEKLQAKDKYPRDTKLAEQLQGVIVRQVGEPA